MQDAQEKTVELGSAEAPILSMGAVPVPGALSLGEMPAPGSIPENTDPDADIAGLTIEAIEKQMEAGTMSVEEGTAIVNRIKEKEFRAKVERMTPLEKANYNINMLNEKIKDFTKLKIEHQSIAHAYEGHIKTAQDLLKKLKQNKRMLEAK